jgi:hypothetical protein
MKTGRLAGKKPVDSPCMMAKILPTIQRSDKTDSDGYFVENLKD